MPITLLYTLALVIDEVVHRDFITMAEYVTEPDGHEYRPDFSPTFSLMMHALVRRTPLYYDNDDSEIGMTGWYSNVPFWRSVLSDY